MEQRWEQFQKDFEQAPDEKRLELARQVVDSEPEFDGEWAFELCQKILPKLKREARLHDADAFLDHISARHPAAAEEEAHWFACWRTEIALLREDGDVRSALLAWVPHAAGNPEIFEKMLDRLRFHDRIDDVIDAAKSAWPVLRDDPDLIDPETWFLTPAVKLVIDRRLELQPGLSPEDPSLWAALEPFLTDLDRGRVIEDLQIRAAPSPRAWQAGALAKSGRKAEENLYLLGMDFRDALHKRFGWSLARAELGREELERALLSQESEATPSRSKSRGPVRPTDRQVLVLPNPNSIDAYLSRQLTTFNFKPHRAAALALALFPWLSFLVEMELLESAQAYSVAGELRQRLEPLPRLLESQIHDPALQQDLKRAFRESALRSPDSPLEERSSP